MNPMPGAIIAWDSFVALERPPVLDISTREKGVALTSSAP